MTNTAQVKDIGVSTGIFIEYEIGKVSYAIHLKKQLRWQFKKYADNQLDFGGAWYNTATEALKAACRNDSLFELLKKRI